MPRLTWGEPGTKFFEAGCDRGVLYRSDLLVGEAWPGLISIDESVIGGEPESLYFEGLKYAEVVGKEDFEATITAFSAPKSFGPCEGSVEIAPGLYADQQQHIPFSMSYRTLLGNDVEGTDYGYEIHLVYNAVAIRGPVKNESLGDQPGVPQKQWSISCVPPYLGYEFWRPTGHLTVNSKGVTPDKLATLEGWLYGTGTTSAYIPPINTITSLLFGG